MSFFDSIRHAFNIVILNQDAASEVALDTDLTWHAFLILIIGGILAGLPSFNVWVVLISPILVVLFSLLSVLILHAIALFLGGTARYWEFFRASAFSGLLGWLAGILGFVTLVPIGVSIQSYVITPIMIIWGTVINVIIIMAVHKISTWRSILTALLPLLIGLALMIIGFILIYAMGVL